MSRRCPCKGGTNLNLPCYVCQLHEREDIWVGKHAVLRQSFNNERKLHIVPRKHVGEFRLMCSSQYDPFWREAEMFVHRLISEYRVEKLTIEVNHGKWLAHRPPCGIYHAHMHLYLSNYDHVLTRLGKRPNTKPMADYGPDFTLDLSPRLFLAPGRPQGVSRYLFQNGWLASRIAAVCDGLDFCFLIEVAHSAPRSNGGKPSSSVHYRVRSARGDRERLLDAVYRARAGEARPAQAVQSERDKRRRTDEDASLPHEHEG